MRRFVAALLVLLVTPALAPADPPTINLSRIEGAFLEPRRLTPQGERLFFEASVRPPSGGEFLPSIWVTRGTLASTIRIPLQGVHPLLEQRLLGVFGQRLFVYAWSPDAAVPGVYVHDLLSSRTELLIRGYVSEAATNREAVFFMIYGGPGEGLYRSDGTRARTRRVRTDTAIGLLGLRGYLLYQAAVPGYPLDAIGLFSSGPNAETLLMVLPTLGETPVIVGDRAFFVRSAFGQVELWSTDGTVEGTHLAAALPGLPETMGTCRGRLLLALVLGSAPQDLWLSDGTSGGTAVLDMLPSWVYPPFGIADAGQTCYVFLGGPSPSRGLWKTDLTPGGAERVADVDYPFPPVGHAVGARGRAFFPAFDGEHGAELWASDGTEAGTGLFADIVPGLLSSSPDEFTRVGGRIFFSAKNEGFARDLWVIDLPPGITIEDASAREQPARTVQAVFRVRLSFRSMEPVTVDYETEAGTAQAGSDFAPRSGTLRFAPGETLKMIRVPVSGDGVREGQEEFTVRLTNPTNAELDRDRATGTIRDPGPRLPGPRH